MRIGFFDRFWLFKTQAFERQKRFQHLLKVVMEKTISNSKHVKAKKKVKLSLLTFANEVKDVKEDSDPQLAMDSIKI
jgi:hypothetical protein